MNTASDIAALIQAKSTMKQHFSPSSPGCEIASGYENLDECRPRRLRLLRFLIVLVCATLTSFRASGRTLEVGPSHILKLPSAAAAAAQDGDVIAIEAGQYVDCAVWTANRLVIMGKGPGAVVTTKTCEGKGIFVIRGHDVTIRNLTFSRARVPDANGAGIRAEGRNLTVERSRFIDNENGILAAADPLSTIRIFDSEFIRNGSCEKECAHGVYINTIALLHIERSKFTGTQVAHHIKTRALSTKLIANEIRDGEEGTSSYLVDAPNGGSLIMEGNLLEKGTQTNNKGAAVVIGAEGVKHPTDELMFKKNSFSSHLGSTTTFVRNLTETNAVLLENRILGRVIPLSGRGTIQ